MPLCGEHVLTSECSVGFRHPGRPTIPIEHNQAQQSRAPPELPVKPPSAAGRGKPLFADRRLNVPATSACAARTSQDKNRQNELALQTNTRTHPRASCAHRKCRFDQRVAAIGENSAPTAMHAALGHRRTRSIAGCGVLIILKCVATWIMDTELGAEATES